MNDNELAVQQINADSRKKRNWVMILLITVLVFAAAGILYCQHLLNLINRPEETMLPTEVSSVPTEETEPPTTSPLETWPEIVSDQNITRFRHLKIQIRETNRFLPGI